MAESFINDESGAAIRAKVNSMAGEVNDLLQRVTDIEGLGTLAPGSPRWQSGNQSSRVSETIGGKMYTFSLVTGGDPSVSPVSQDGWLEWTLEPGGVYPWSIDIGRYVALNGLVFHDGTLWRVLQRGNTQPGVNQSTHSNVVSDGGSENVEGDYGTISPAAPFTMTGTTQTFTMSGLPPGRSITVSVHSAQPSSGENELYLSSRRDPGDSLEFIVDNLPTSGGSLWVDVMFSDDAGNDTSHIVYSGYTAYTAQAGHGRTNAAATLPTPEAPYILSGYSPSLGQVIFGTVTNALPSYRTEVWIDGELPNTGMPVEGGNYLFSGVSSPVQVAIATVDINTNEYSAPVVGTLTLPANPGDDNTSAVMTADSWTNIGTP